MGLAIKAIILYFPIVFIYKVFGDASNNYWINAYWLAVSIDSIIVFIGIRKSCLSLTLLHKETIKIYRDVAFTAAVYWGVMAAIRVYLFFNIELHYQLISSAGKLTTGAIMIVLIFIYLTAKKWFKK